MIRFSCVQERRASMSPSGRILRSVAALLLLLHWNALAFEGGLGADHGRGASFQTIGNTHPFILAEVGRPLTVKQRQTGEPERPLADGPAKALPSSPLSVDLQGATNRVEPAQGALPLISRTRAFDARGPPRRA
jgi:hypothetical protein